MADDVSPALETLVGDRARDDKGRFIPVPPTEVKEPEKVSEPVIAQEPAKPLEVKPEPKVEKPSEAIPLTALLYERDKRQAYERRIKELESQLAQVTKKPEPEVDPWQDLPGALSRQQKALEQSMQQRFLAMSEDMARANHKDFDEVLGHFEQAVQANPALAAQMTTSRNPAEFAYQQGLWHREISQAGDPVAYRTKLEAEIRAKLEAELKSKTDVPTSINTDSSPPVKEATYQGPPPINSLLLNGRKT